MRVCFITTSAKENLQILQSLKISFSEILDFIPSLIISADFVNEIIFNEMNSNCVMFKTFKNKNAYKFKTIRILKVDLLQKLLLVTVPMRRLEPQLVKQKNNFQENQKDTTASFSFFFSSFFK